jgi:hypothetical protein
VVGDHVAENAATLFLVGDIKDFIRIEFNKADAWFEEDEQIYAHPKDPYKVDIPLSIRLHPDLYICVLCVC